MFKIFKKKSVLVKRIISIIVISVLIMVFYCVMDLLNVSSKIIDVNKMNWDSTAIIIGNIIVIDLFLITYYTIDCRNVEKDRNQRKIAVHLLIDSYDQCEEMIHMFENEYALKHAVSHCNFDKLEFQDTVMQQYLNIPFEHNNMICDFAQNGIISVEEFDKYLNIQKCYKSHVRVKLTFFDKETFSQYKKDELFALINDAKDLLERNDKNV